MKNIIKKLLITLLLGLTPAFASGGHSHDASEYVIENNAKYELGKLIKKGKFNNSWKEAKKVKMIKQGLPFNKEWVVGFKNNTVADVNKQTVYIYLTTYGKYKGANYKGN